MVPTMNSLVRKALLGTNRRRGPFFTIVYLQKEAGLSLSWTRVKTVAVMEEQEGHSILPSGATPQVNGNLSISQSTLQMRARHWEEHAGAECSAAAHRRSTFSQTPSNQGARPPLAGVL